MMSYFSPAELLLKDSDGELRFCIGIDADGMLFLTFWADAEII